MESPLRESFRGQARGVYVGQLGLRLVLCALALLLTVSFVVAGPLAPLSAPPAGQVWVQAGGAVGPGAGADVGRAVRVCAGRLGPYSSVATAWDGMDSGALGA
jgi:hypothetical protein